MTCRKRVKITRFHKIIGGTRVGGERYGYLYKALSVTEGERKYTYDYHVDGQLARADYGNGKAEDFLWDGLALIKRGDERFVNEPHIGGGDPVASSNGTTYFNDALGTTVGICEGRASSRPKSGRKYTAAALTAFGETIEDDSLHSPTPTQNSNSFYTGKPEVAGLGHAFLFRNYRASLAKWQTADPLGYPDGWNQLAYCGNGVASAVDFVGGHKIYAKDGIVENGYMSKHGLGCWYLLDANCSGSYENLNITYTITRKEGSQLSFNDEAELVLPNIGRISDPCAKFSGFSSKIEGLKRTPNKRSDINELTVEFDWIVEYIVTIHYVYEVVDPDTGEKHDENGVAEVPQSVKKHVVLNCFHRKME